MKPQKRSFTVTFIEDSVNQTIEKSVNKGFTAIEMVGLLEMKKEDIREQLVNEPKFKRYYLDKDGKKIEVINKSEDTE